MVKRRVSISRRLRANAGAIVNASLWASAALTCAVLYLVRAPDLSSPAVAIVARHGVVVPESGRLASLDVVDGQAVVAGQQLGTVEVPGLSETLTAASAELAALQIQASAGNPDRARHFEKDTAGAQARWLDARVTLEAERADLLARDLEIARLKAAGSGVPASQLEQAQATREALAKEIAAREESTAALERAYASARSLGNLGTDPVLEARVQGAAAQIASLTARMENAVLRAPIAGVVTAPPGGQLPAAGAFPVPGVWLPAGTAALTVVEPGTREAVIYLPAVRVRELSEGAPVSLVSALGEVVPARVADIAPAVQPVPVQQLRDPAVLEWAVPVTLRTESAVLLPGESFALSN